MIHFLCFQTNIQKIVVNNNFSCSDDTPTTVGEPVGQLNHEDQKQTHHSTHQISTKTRFIQCTIVQFIYGNFSIKCVYLPTRMLPIIVTFLCICFSLRCVAILLRCVEIFSNHFMFHCPENVLIKTFKNRLILV